MRNVKNVLVTAAGGGAGINALRLLVKYDQLRLFATDIDPHSSGQIFANEFRTMASFASRNQYEKDLLKMIDEWSIDYIIPTLQEELEDINNITKNTKAQVILSDFETVSLCCNKIDFYRWVRENLPEFSVGFHILGDSYLWDVDDIFLFLKPIKGRGSTGCRRIAKYEIPKYCNAFWNYRDYLVMEDLPGKEYTVDCYVSKGGYVPYIVPRERIQTMDGVSLKGRTLRDNRIIDATQKIIDKLKFRGPICIQWKEDKEGNLKILEINPRLSGGHMITVASGANAMECFYDEYINGNVPFSHWYETTVLGYLDYKVIL